MRAAKLERDPICERPGCGRLATEVDHIIRLKAGGSKYDHDNLQSLCTPHHADKTVFDSTRG